MADPGKQEILKQKAAYKAAAMVRSGMILGLGSGSTADLATVKIGKLLASGKLSDIIGIPSSGKTAKLAREMKIPLASLDDHDHIDLTIDGADEVDPDLNMIKGGGGMLLNEKINIQASRKVVIIIDESKLSERLGDNWPVPIEVISSGSKQTINFLNSLGGKAKYRKLMNNDLFITDNGNIILDTFFGSINDPAGLSLKLKTWAGVVEHGLFIDMTSEVIVAGHEGIRTLEKI